MLVSLSEVEPTEEAYLTNRLSPDSLKSEPNIFEILTKKAKGHPNGLWNLAVCYDCAIGTKQMPDLANAYYLMAWTQAQLDEGKISIDTKEKGLNLEKGLNFLLFTPDYKAYYDAALKGCPIAAYQAGLCLLNGIGVKEDDLLAVAFFTSATSAGVADAAYALGNCLEHGYGLPMDKKKAASFYQKAADGGSAGGKCNLGILLYNEGQVEKGLQLIKEASDLGFSEASKILQSLNEEDSRNPTSSQALHLFEESMVDNSFSPSSLRNKSIVLRPIKTSHKNQSRCQRQSIISMKEDFLICNVTTPEHILQSRSTAPTITSTIPRFGFQATNQQSQNTDAPVLLTCAGIVPANIS